MMYSLLPLKQQLPAACMNHTCASFYPIIKGLLPSSTAVISPISSCKLNIHFSHCEFRPLASVEMGKNKAKYNKKKAGATGKAAVKKPSAKIPKVRPHFAIAADAATLQKKKPTPESSSEEEVKVLILLC